MRFPMATKDARVEATAPWNGQGMDSIKVALKDPKNVWVEFLRPNEIPAGVDPMIKEALAQGMDEDTKNRITAQICDGLRDRLP